MDNRYIEIVNEVLDEIHSGNPDDWDHVDYLKEADRRYAALDPFEEKAQKPVIKGQVKNPAALVNTSNGLELAQRQLGVHDPGFMAFVRAAQPVKGLYRYLKRPRWQRIVIQIWARIKVITAMSLVSLKRACRRIKTVFKKQHRQLRIIEPIIGVEMYLSTAAQALLKKRHAQTVVEVGGPGKIAFARFAAMRVPLEVDGSVSETYVKRWAAFLDHLAFQRIWQHGVMTPPSTMLLAQTGLRYEKVLFTQLFTDQMPEDDDVDPRKAVRALNEKVGFEVFRIPGEIPVGCDWSQFPY